MTSPHSPYTHAHPGHNGPGPSTYFHPSQPPPHPHMYGAHSPAPGPHYNYPYPPPPPHMNPHQGHQPHSPARGGRQNSYSTRNHNPYNYYAPQYPHPGAVPMHAPNPHPYPGKYNQPYAPPPYGYPNPAAMPFTPPSSAHPTAHLSAANGYYDPGSPAAQRPPVHVPEKPGVPPPPPPAPVVQHEPTPAAPEEPVEQPQQEESPAEPAPEPIVAESEPAALEPESEAPAASSTPYDTMGSIQTHDNVPSSPQASSPQVINPTVPLAIWSRRPHDPSSAPAIIISPQAQPPQNVVEQAIDDRTPPPSPTPEPRRLPRRRKQPAANEKAVTTAKEESLPSSSAVTEVTDESTVPVSPVSSSTSVSASVAPAKENEEPAPEAEAQPGPADESSEPPAAEELPPIPEESSKPEPQPEAEAPAASTSAPGPAPAPTPAASPVKKSWASLLRPAASADASGSSKNSLPTSSIVGFSIPASALSAASSSPSPSVSVSPSKKTELLNLLTSPPSGSSSAGKIKPKGLVNSGNMCFANSVLQILVYCPPFNRLFVELGKVLPGAEKEGKGGGTATPSSTSNTPLVDATAMFLKEFVKEKKQQQPTPQGSSSGYGRGKGKERQVMDDDDEWEMDSFLPTYIYDAMKEKKRFDTMRGGQQEDAEEFLGFYLDTLEEELLSLLNSVNPTKPAKPQVEEKEESAPQADDGWMEVGKKNRMMVTRTFKATESPITRIFGGKFRSTLRAPRQKDSVIVEDWRSLRLDIQREQIKTIQDALSFISHPEPVQVSLSTQPGVAVEATQQVLIESLPPILVLHIKRFHFDTNAKGVVKVSKQVTFGPELEILPDLMAPNVRKATSTRYKLFGALYHHGSSASGGHYTLDVLHSSRYPGLGPNAKPKEGWIRIDDELVSDVRAEDVFGNQERDDSRCAYLLFYRRVW
ncbi:hypothetical protein BKA70DRAFT_1387774 [Coprinopsis sp. MPI-PUGE-AT-0042]|nr:hypothetical protein BKA70DRAFT_1387774 [Coprinopsis sp. MPI-PUGE-AT-0042]